MLLRLGLFFGPGYEITPHTGKERVDSNSKFRVFDYNLNLLKTKNLTDSSRAAF